MNINMKRILIVGSGGAGKSTLAVELGHKLNLPVIHLDKEYWRPGWIKPKPEEWDQHVSSLLHGEKWIIDGNFTGTLAQRIIAADTIIYLNLPPIVCLWRILKRRFQFIGTSHYAMAEGCPQKIDFEFIKWVWSYQKSTAPRIKEIFNRNSSNKKIIELKSISEVESFFKGV